MEIEEEQQEEEEKWSLGEQNQAHRFPVANLS